MQRIIKAGESNFFIIKSVEGIDIINHPKSTRVGTSFSGELPKIVSTSFDFLLDVSSTEIQRISLSLYWMVGKLKVAPFLPIKQKYNYIYMTKIITILRKNIIKHEYTYKSYIIYIYYIGNMDTPSSLAPS